MSRHFSDEEYLKLRKAEKLLADVQCPMRDEGDWEELYRIRCALGREVFNRRPDTWAQLEARGVNEP